jgi:hypothetical protein
MAASDGHRACEDAAAYYHDFLLDPGDPSLPRSVAEHIERCAHCRGQVERLGELLAEAERECQPCGLEADRRLLAELQRHFEHVGDRIGCEQTKPLLPSLLLASLQIRIPTPVTVHVDHCGECIRDLAALKGLALDDEQLVRLSRLYHECSGDDSRTCEQVRPAMTVLGSVSLEGLDPEISRHLCVCRTCRDAVYERRQEWLDRQRRAGLGTAGGCRRDVSMAAVFDYVVPYGRAVRSDARDSLKAHLRSCPQCLEKLQTLHRAVYGVIERPDSKVITTYAAMPAGREASEPVESVYAGHPITIEVSGLGPEPVVGTVRRRSTSNRELRPLIRTAFLAAAMIPLAVVFWMSTRSASGLSVRQISDTIADAPAAYIKTIHTYQAEPTQEVWVSSARQTIVRQTPQGKMVYDLANRRKFFIGAGRTTVQRVEYEAGEFRRCQRMMRDRLEFDMASLDAQLVRLDQDSGASEGAEVYELTWTTMDSRRAPVPRRWSVFIDPVTRRPQRTEFCSKLTPEGPWELETVKLFTYPDPSEIDEIVEALLTPQPLDAVQGSQSGLRPE